MANSTNFTATMALATASSTTTGRCTASSRRWTAGKRCSGFCRGKGGAGWFKLTHSVVSYDHPHHALLEEAITLDFVNSALGPNARVAVELTLPSAKELSGALAKAIAAAEIEESARLHKLQ